MNGLKKISLFLFFSAAVFCKAEDVSALWSGVQKFPSPKYRTIETPEKGVVGIIYEGEDWKGRPTEVFAYYSSPSVLGGGAREADANLPAVVCVHGGGGKAYPEWVKLWAKRGYAAIAPDLYGNGFDGKSLDMSGPKHNGSTTRISEKNPPKDTWVYNAAANVARAHSLIRSFKEVNPEKTAITGISWGGFLTCVSAGIDGRYKAAAPVYGCGYYHLENRWNAYVGTDEAAREAWAKYLDPSARLGKTKIPMLFINSQRDPYFTMKIWSKTSALAADANRKIDFDMKHSQKYGAAPEEILAFFSDKLGLGGAPLAKIEKPEVKSGAICAKYSAAVPVKIAKFYWTRETESANCEKFEASKLKWNCTDAKIESGELKVSPIPEGARSGWFSATDSRGLSTSSACADFGK